MEGQMQIRNNIQELKNNETLNVQTFLNPFKLICSPKSGTQQSHKERKFSFINSQLQNIRSKMNENAKIQIYIFFETFIQIFTIITHIVNV